MVVVGRGRERVRVAGRLVVVVEARVVVVVVVLSNHIWALVALHVRGEGGGSVVAAITNGALERFPMVVSFQVDFQVV